MGQRFVKILSDLRSNRLERAKNWKNKTKGSGAYIKNVHASGEKEEKGDPSRQEVLLE